MVRYLGGDPTLVEEIERNREAQQLLPEDNIARLFGQDVEARDASIDATDPGSSSAIIPYTPPVDTSWESHFAYDVRAVLAGGCYLELVFGTIIDGPELTPRHIICKGGKAVDQPIAGRTDDYKRLHPDNRVIFAIFAKFPGAAEKRLKLLARTRGWLRTGKYSDGRNGMEFFVFLPEDAKELRRFYEIACEEDDTTDVEQETTKRLQIEASTRIAEVPARKAEAEARIAEAQLEMMRLRLSSAYTLVSEAIPTEPMEFQSAASSTQADAVTEAEAEAEVDAETEAEAEEEAEAEAEEEEEEAEAEAEEEEEAEAQSQPTHPPPQPTSAPQPASAPPPGLHLHSDGYQMTKAREYVAVLRATGLHPDRHVSPIGGWLYNYSRGIAGKGSMKPRDDVTAYLRAELGEYWDGLVARAQASFGTDQAAKSARLTRELIAYYEAHDAVAPFVDHTQELNRHWHALVQFETSDVIKAYAARTSADPTPAPRLYSGVHVASIAVLKASIMKERFAAAVDKKRRKIPGQPATLP